MSKISYLLFSHRVYMLHNHAILSRVLPGAADFEFVSSNRVDSADP